LAILGVTARALTQAARRAPGYAEARIVALDWFADRDLIAAADHAEALPTRRRGGFAERPLLKALERLVPEGSLLVTGSGFESRLPLLARIGARYRLAGNAPSALARVKDPAQFFAELARLGIPHPEVAREVPGDDRAGWLVKRIGGAGGGHIRPARRGGSVAVGSYAQRRVEGRAVSLAFLADGRRAEPVGSTQQWASPARSKPFRYGGAAFPAELPPALAGRLEDWAERLARAFALRGLCSADLLVEGDRAVLLEVNARPGATVDLLDRARPGLFAAHVEACFGRLRAPPPKRGPARAALILYADAGPLPIGVEDWPGWCADLPHTGSAIPAGGPICTIFGEGADAAAARRNAERCAAVLMERLGATGIAPAPPIPLRL
jgi:uncharacterized protein